LFLDFNMWCSFVGKTCYSSLIGVQKSGFERVEVYSLRKNAMKLYFGILASTVRPS
jgi:hypothetical protein